MHCNTIEHDSADYGPPYTSVLPANVHIL